MIRNPLEYLIKAGKLCGGQASPDRVIDPPKEQSDYPQHNHRLYRCACGFAIGCPQCFQHHRRVCSDSYKFESYS